jgi:hypothetical protein
MPLADYEMVLRVYADTWRATQNHDMALAAACRAIRLAHRRLTDSEARERADMLVSLGKVNLGDFWLEDRARSSADG